MDLPAQIERNIHERQLVADGQPLLVAVSGGPDSMVLLRVLKELAASHQWRLVVAHFNHQLRGRSSDADERLVRRVAAGLGLPIVVGRAAARAFAQRRGISLEMAARELRHGFLARLARRRGIPTIALAHHADDQVELFFLRLLRGSGGEGLGGMKWRGPSPSSVSVELVRPLLNLPKTALLDYAVQHKVRFREDATNTSLDLQRNQIRHELLPLLEKEYQPALRRTIPRVMDILREEAGLAAQVAQEWTCRSPATTGLKGEGWRLALEGVLFADLPVAVQRKTVQLQLLELGIAADFETTERLRLAPDRPVAVAHSEQDHPARPQLVARGQDGRIRLQPAEPPRFARGIKDLPLVERAGTVEFAGLRISWELRPALAGLPLGAPGCEVFDADKVGSGVVVRHWRPGDRFQPIGMRQTVKLQDIFVNQKIPRDQRHQLVVVTTAAGEIFWVEGCRISERFKVTRHTKRCLHWRWKRV